MQWLGKQLGYTEPENWYQISKEDFHFHHGGSLLASCYQNSPSLAVMAYFKNYDWKEWLFKTSSKNFWGNPQNRQRYMKWLGEQLGYKNPEDWYKITQKDFHKNNGHSYLKNYQGSPSVAVIAEFSDYDWQLEKFSTGKKRQKQLFRIIKKIFSEHDVHWDFKHTKLRFRETNYPMELDVFIPSLNLAFEYQGEQHVLPISVWGGISGLRKRQKDDEEKRKACKKHELFLIEVFHTWNGSEKAVIDILLNQLNGKGNTKQIQTIQETINIYINNQKG